MAIFGKSKDGSGGSILRRRSIDFDSADVAVLESEINNWVGHNRPKLGEVMLELGSIDPDQLIEALQHQKEAPSEEGAAQLGQVLLDLGSIDETALAAALAQQFGIPLADLRNEMPDPEAVAFVGEQLARKHTVIPLRKEDDRYFMAIADPLDTQAIEELTKHCRRIGLLMGTRSEIERLLDASYNVLNEAQTHIQAFELSNEDIARDRPEEQAFAVDDNAPVVQVVNRIITQGVRSRASDVHIEPAEDLVRVRYRVDGAMTEAIQLPTAMAAAISSRVKVMANLNIVERRRPQDGQFGVTVDGRPIDIRLSTANTVHGEKCVMRLLDKSQSLISLPDLGMHPAVAEAYIDLVSSPLGMVLCTGPTGSGKTTTLYATLTEINDPTRNVVTIEDPVEYQFDGISQMPISETGITFADGLRSILRQDPDIILVGEIRDEETARIGMQAALTGHLVLSSLHAVDAVSALHRFIDMGIEPFLIASSLSGVVGQRLLRRTCTSCAAPHTPTPADIRIVDEHVGHQPAQWIKGTGCNLCGHTGYRGRLGVYELLEMNDEIRELVVARASHHEVRLAAIEGGMKTMQTQAFELVVNGKTTVDEVIRSVYAPGADRRQVQDPKQLGPGKRALNKARDALEPGMDEADVLPEDHDPIKMGPGDESPLGATTEGATTERIASTLTDQREYPDAVPTDVGVR